MSEDLTRVQSSLSQGLFQPGAKVFNRYLLKHIAGRGGMGVVWAAEDTQLDQTVALKVLPDVILHDAEAINDLKRETKRCLKLNHHNIVRIYDFIQDATGAAISMEFVDGDTLTTFKLRGEHRCLEPDQVVPWLPGLCQALHYAHKTAKIVHRDLKPSNVMVTKDGTVKITDFGIATSISDSLSRVSLRSTTSGTLTYMSPQQARGLRPSHLDDIYALGALLYDLLTGKPPFYTGNIQHQLESVPPDPLHVRRNDLGTSPRPLPPEWEETVLRCLAKEPAERPQSILEVASSLGVKLGPLAEPDEATVRDLPPLDRTLPDLPPPVPTTTVSPPATQPTRPPPPASPPRPPFNWMPWAAGFAVLVLLLAGIAGGLYFLGGKGTLVVDSFPPGARVTVGPEVGNTPFEKKGLAAGKKQVTISLPGFDPVRQDLVIKRDQVTDLGTIQLQRSTGSLELSSFPPGATFVLRLKQPEVPAFPEKFEEKAVSPALIPNLPTGTYTLTASFRNFPAETKEVQIQASEALRIEKDFILDRTVATLPANLRGLLAQPLTASLVGLSDADRKLVAATLEKLGQEYMAVGSFRRAAALTEPLGQAGGDPAAYQNTLQESQAKWLKAQGTALTAALRKEDFSTARSILDSFTQLTDPGLAGSLQEEYQKARAEFDRAIAVQKAEAESLLASGNPKEAANVLARLEKRSPDDPALLLLATQTDLLLPAARDRINQRISRIDAGLSWNHLESSTRAALTSHLSVFQKAADRHKNLSSQLASVEASIRSLRGKLPGLEQALKTNRQKQTGYAVLGILGLGAGIGGAAGGSGEAAGAGAGAAAIGGYGAAARGRDIDALNAEIASVKNQIAAKESEAAKLKAEISRLQNLSIAEAGK